MSETRQRFFTSYSGVKLPLKLVGELGEADIENRNTYYRAGYDAHDRLIVVEKRVYGDIEVCHRYEYNDAGTLVRAEIDDDGGETTVLTFREGG